MDCTTIRELLEEYALGLLEPDLHQQVALHLIDCAECQAIYQNYAVLLARNASLGFTLPIAG
jgi:predicted anti-sigma-YlaC factor YlaD